MLYSIALTFIPSITPSLQLELLRHIHSAEAIVMHPEECLSSLNDTHRFKTINTILAHREQALKRAQEELDFCRQHNIQVLPYQSADYPTRLVECPDAPTVLYYRGSAQLNPAHVLAIVGTRHITAYGKQVCAALTERLAQLLPDVLVVSGLAYGVDIHAHRGCLDHHLATVGVMAHGLDQIYPASHRNDAKRMLAHGGILTEYPRGTRPLQGNFLRRNRIVAGMADATIVVESAEHGGSLVTARIADSYQREVFAFPGRTNDPYSEGCNALIASLKAQMALSADSIVESLNWWKDTQPYRAVPQQLDLFTQTDTPHPSAPPPAQRRLAELLRGSDGLNATVLAEQSGLSQTDVNAALFDMEMDGLVKILPGGFYILSK